jgi:SAM-dependent methyltransferase
MGGIMPEMKDRLQQARGYFNQVELKDSRLCIRGWMLLPDIPFDDFLIFINKCFICRTEVAKSQDVAAAFGFIAHADRAAFSADMEIERRLSHDLIVICVVGVSKGVQIAKMETVYSDKSAVAVAFPACLMTRVANNDNRSYFVTSSFKSFWDYYQLVRKYCFDKRIATMLDWGCGCGRMAIHFRNLANIENIFGCDIDLEAVTWCRDNIREARFDVIDPYPPTGYPDNYFDLIIGNSVFTHLSRDVQIVWLREMQRILSPGGLFLASVHGEFAAYFSFPGTVDDILKNGIYDYIEDSNLSGIAPAGYYRGSYQSQQYSMEVFGRFFDILEYVERGSTNFQDIIVMRK